MPINFFPKNEDERQALTGQMDAAREKWEAKYGPLFLAAFDEVIEAIAKEIAESGDFNDRFDSQVIFDVLEMLYLEVSDDFVSEAAQAVESETGEPVEKERAWKIVRDWMAVHLASKLLEMDKYTRRIARGIVVEGRIGELVAGEIAEELLEWHKRNREARAALNATTSTVHASNLGTRSAFVASGREVYKMWNTRLDGKERDSHAIAHTQPRRMEEPFDLEGGQLMEPGDTSLGVDMKEIYNCRCAMSFDFIEGGG